jgi:hypothetical protein
MYGQAPRGQHFLTHIFLVQGKLSVVSRVPAKLSALSTQRGTGGTSSTPAATHSTEMQARLWTEDRRRTENNFFGRGR